jgi:hypothetical protein
MTFEEEHQQWLERDQRIQERQRALSESVEQWRAES